MQATRHKANKTRFNRASKIVSWSLELIFHTNTNMIANRPPLIKLHTRKNLFSSKDTLRVILKKFYEKYKTELFESGSVHKIGKEANISVYTEFNGVFEENSPAGFKGVNVLFQVCDIERQKKYFVRYVVIILLCCLVKSISENQNYIDKQ